MRFAGLKQILNVKTLGLLAVAGLISGGIVTSPAGASDPTSGTVTKDHRTRSWTGGPFVAANPMAQAGDQPDCSAPDSCDDYKLSVDTPGGYGDTHRLLIKVAWLNAAADFDVYLLKDGKVVSTAASSADPEQIIIPPNSGTYTVRVVPFAPLGES